MDGTKVYVYRRGRGSPAVVIEAGHFNIADDWTDVVDLCGRTTLTFAYDRPGLANSDPAKGPQTPTAVARELRELLRAMDVPAPVVLVGHSLGGLYVRRFAELYPSEVAGLVLVDASDPHQRSQLPPTVDSFYRSLRRRRAMPDSYSRDRWVARALSLQSHVSRAALEARFDPLFRPASLRVARQHLASAWGSRGRVGTRPLPRVPLAVITAGCPDPAPHIPPDLSRTMLEHKQRRHRAQARIIPGGRLVVAERSGHSVMWQQPEIIADVVAEMLQQIRRGSPRGRAARRRSP